MLKDEVEESLEAFSTHDERTSTDPMRLIREVYQGYHRKDDNANKRYVRAKTLNTKDIILAADGQTRFQWFDQVLKEARSPVNAFDAQANEMIVQLAQLMASKGLMKMRDPKIAIADWLASQGGKR
ncbi:MAG: hypothetical protein SGPRY_000628 [Prymnesium sp.]